MAVGGRIEKRVDLAREGGGRRLVADDVGERGPPAAASDALEMPALVRVRQPTTEGGAKARPAHGRHTPFGWGLG